MRKSSDWRVLTMISENKTTRPFSRHKDNMRTIIIKLKLEVLYVQGGPVIAFPELTASFEVLEKNV